MKNIIWLSGLAMAAVVATGCAGGPESLAMESDNALTQVVGEGLVTLSADRELPVTGAAPSITEAITIDDATVTIRFGREPVTLAEPVAACVAALIATRRGRSASDATAASRCDGRTPR